MIINTRLIDCHRHKELNALERVKESIKKEYVYIENTLNSLMASGCIGSVCKVVKGADMVSLQMSLDYGDLFYRKFHPSLFYRKDSDKIQKRSPLTGDLFCRKFAPDCERVQRGTVCWRRFYANIPLGLVFLGLSEPLRLAGLKDDEVLQLFDGLEALPDVEVSVLSVLEELCELWKNFLLKLVAYFREPKKTSIVAITFCIKTDDRKYNSTKKIIINLNSFLISSHHNDRDVVEIIFLIEIKFSSAADEFSLSKI
ncbi:hypothetical protein FF38_08263 [Lucilia cuprina]|uniref:Uncharacterized protein n=1 Tax=Lucilia cuprina TaxID=7375 RepID=A0A0L0BYX3_LUCCU|nr:hypothetical protein FF38_08263 [Lucilia cuprina]